MGRLACGLSAALLIAACESGHGGNNSYGGKTIRLGAVLSLTGAGAAVGTQSRDGMLLAVKQLNASGGVDGAQVELSVEDDASDKEQSAQKAKSLAQQIQVLALLGPTLANSATDVFPLAESLKTPIIAVSTPGSHIVPDCAYPDTTPCKYVFRDSLGEQTAIPANIKTYVDDAHPGTAVLLVAEDERLSSDDGKLAVATFGLYKIRLLKTIPMSRNVADPAPLVTQAVQLKPDVIFIATPGAVSARIMVDARNFGYQGQFLGGDGLNNPAIAKLAGAAGRGARSASAWYLGIASARNQIFVDGYRTAYLKDPDQVAAQSFTAIELLADAAARANLTFTDVARDRERLRAAMESGNIQSPLGPLRFNSDHDVRQTIWIVQMDGRGGFTAVKQISPS
ncbi:MAG TPA: ABC transporter substrate-binding protein [Candidatus Dormibacteraeota bacterium]|nr:ABC transporter substrate-binding protein [Candidatus Dormibacteraeota bacterium]